MKSNTCPPNLDELILYLSGTPEAITSGLLTPMEAIGTVWFQDFLKTFSLDLYIASYFVGTVAAFHQTMKEFPQFGHYSNQFFQLSIERAFNDIDWSSN